jgi:hypothetical protein
VKTIYLDQMHWIGLAQARTGHRDGARYLGAFEGLSAGVAAGNLSLPLSSVHYDELRNTGSLRRRTDVALTMGILSGYVTVAAREAILKAELRHALGKWRGLAIPPPSRQDVFGHGFAFAFGELIGPGDIVGPEGARTHLFSRANEVIDELESRIGGGWTYSRRLSSANGEALVVGAMREAAEFLILRGPRPEEMDELRSGYGYKPETFTNMIAESANREKALAQMLADGTARKDRLDDIVAARLFFWELGPLLPELLTELDIPRAALFDGGRAVLDLLLDDMPMMQVEYALRRGNFKNGSRPWTTHDIHDLSMLGRAIPYCDVVVTEAHAAHQLKFARLGERYGTVILRDVAGLIPLLHT